MDYYIGLMSGTSCDGIDAVLADFSNANKVVCHQHHPYPKDLTENLRAIIANQTVKPSMIAACDAALGLCYAQSVQQLLSLAKVSAKAIKAIGCHGQTVWHAPEAPFPTSWQLGDANKVAALTQITTVADFRRKDIAHGGQGAPLTPAFHAKFFARDNLAKVIVNIGGMANITLIPSEPNQLLRGFDTGPGNCLLDFHARQCLNQAYDVDGQWAQSGNVQQVLLDKMLSCPYFQACPPKSTGHEYFNAKWLESFAPKISPQDLQATLTALTAASISQAILKYQPGPADVIICGGGAFNKTLMENCRAYLPGYHLYSSEKFGIHPMHVEALAFAWFAKCAIENQALDLQPITGTSRPLCLGNIYRP